MNRAVELVLLLVLSVWLGLGGDPDSCWGQQAENNPLDRKDIDVSAGTGARTRWDTGYVEVKASATADARVAVNRAQATSMALKAARHLAYEKLAETLEGLNLTGETSLGQAIVQRSSLRTELRAKIRGARVVSETVTDASDGSVWADVVMGVSLAGKDGISGTLTEWATVQPSSPYRPNPAYATEGRYTGIIVEASGLGFSPGLMPRLLAADDLTEIYGPSRIAPRALESQGFVGYADSLHSAKGARVGAHPLLVRAVGVAGDRKGDLLISRRDAERLLTVDRERSVLSHGAVVIVVGKTTRDVLREGQRYALVVGVNDHAYAAATPAIPALRFAAADANDFARFLVARGGYAAEHVHTLANEKATRAAIYDAIRQLRARVNEEDSVVFFFSGHGTSGTGRDGLPHYYLVPHDGKAADLDGTAIRDDIVEELIGQLPAKKVVVLLDACHSGGLGGPAPRGFTNPAAVTNPPARSFMDASEGRVILAASRPDQVAVEDNTLRHGVFTHFLLEGMAGAADIDGDGSVSVLEAYQYLSTRVRDYTTRAHGIDQHPMLEVRGMSRELILASFR